MIDKIKRIVEPVVQDFNAELVGVTLKGAKRNYILIVFVDRIGGVTIEDCTKISRQLSKEQELDDLLGNNYRLEVSSPGMDRPLKTPQDFKRNVGRFLEIEFEDKAGLHKLKGNLKKADEKLITLEDKNGAHDVPIHSIIKAIQGIKW